MSASLAISLGQHSDKGRKSANQDFYGALIPAQPALDLKGIAIALADGISSSDVSSIAAQTAIKSFLTDYYDTSDSWPVKTSAHRVISATNAWLHAQTRARQADDVDSGYVCTLSVLVLKSRAAHIFHIGDSRVYRLAGRSLEQLTTDHRVPAAANRFYLGRALGIGGNVEVDYRSVPVGVGDIFVLTTDGVHEHVEGAVIADAIADNPEDLDAAVRHAVWGRMKNSGQSCTGSKRFIIIDRHYEEFAGKFTQALSTQSRENGDYGPLASDDATSTLVAQVQGAIDQGAELVVGDNTPDGNFYRPGVLVNISPQMDVYSEELFGPVAQLYRVSSDEEAIELANSSPYGLGSVVICDDLDRAERVGEQLDVGMVYVNAAGLDGADVPFGGVKKSGFGRELGRLGIDEFTNKKIYRYGR